MRASIVSTSMPTSETRTYASITSPLSRMMSITSARPLGLGRSRYPRGVAVATAIASLRSRSSLLLFALGWTRWARRGVHATASAWCVFVHVLTVVVFLVEVRLVLRRFVAFFSLVIDVAFVVAVGLVLDVGLLLGVDALVVLRLVGLLVFGLVLVLGLVLVVEVLRRLVFDVEVLVVVVVTEPARLGQAIADPLGQIADARHVTEARNEARPLLDRDASRSGERCTRGHRLDPGPVLALVRNG